MYRLYIDYGKGYEKEKEHTLETIWEKIENTDYVRYVIIKRENNTDYVVDIGEREFVKVKKR